MAEYALFSALNIAGNHHHASRQPQLCTIIYHGVGMLGWTKVEKERENVKKMDKLIVKQSDVGWMALLASESIPKQNTQPVTRVCCVLRHECVSEREKKNVKWEM